MECMNLDTPTEYSDNSGLNTLVDIIPDPNYNTIERLDEIILHECYNQLTPLIAQLLKRNQEVA